MKRILLGQLGANGDCLYATIIARQLRNDEPDAEITWAISSQCAEVIKHNPHIDHIWTIDIPGWDQHDAMWRLFEAEAFRLYGRREFDDVYLSQIWPNNFHNYDGTIRSSLLRNFPRPITVPIENVVVLDDAERERTRSFVHDAGIMNKEHRIIFECSSKSGQSFITPDKSQDIAEFIYRLLPDAVVIFSTHLPMTLRHPRSCYAGTLSLREVAELTHYATMFVGCGSGCTVVASSSASKVLPMLQLLSASTSVYASFAHDFEYFGLTERSVLEITDENPETIAQCIAAVCKHGAAEAGRLFESRVPVAFDHFRAAVTAMLLKRNRIIDASRAVSITSERYGWTPELVRFARADIVDKLTLDPRWRFPSGRLAADRFKSQLEAAGGGARSTGQRRWAEGSAFLPSR